MASLLLGELIARLFAATAPSTVPAEAGSRRCDSMFVFDEHTGWWPKAGLDCIATWERPIPIRTNSAGFRSDHEFRRKAQGTVRIGVLGDSFTFGSQVASEETYAALIERNVPGVEIVNFGLSGGGPDQSLLALRYKGPTLQLDALIVAPSVENVQRVVMTERSGRRKPFFTLVDGRLELHGHPVAVPQSSRIPASVRDETGGFSFRRLALWQLTLAGIQPIALSLGLYRPFAAEYGGPPGVLLERILASFKETSGGLPIVFAPLPTYHYIEYDLPRDYEPVFRRAADAVGGTYVDILPAFKRLSPRDRRALRFRSDPHYTPLAHRIVADVLRPYVAVLTSRGADAVH